MYRKSGELQKEPLERSVKIQQIEAIVCACFSFFAIAIIIGYAPHHYHHDLFRIIAVVDP